MKLKIKKFVASIGIFALTFMTGFTADAKDVSDYQDVQKGDWFYSTVADISERGFMTGMTDTVFAPAENLQRGQLATIIYRMNGSPKQLTNTISRMWQTACSTLRLSHGRMKTVRSVLPIRLPANN